MPVKRATTLDKLGIKKHERFDLAEWAHVFMKEYGMSFEEFKSLPIPTFYALAEQLNNEAKEKQKQYEKMNHGRRKHHY